jgi:hypothetical protein
MAGVNTPSTRAVVDAANTPWGSDKQGRLVEEGQDRLDFESADGSVIISKYSSRGFLAVGVNAG